MRNEKLFQIDSGYFCAGIVCSENFEMNLICVDAAPIIRYFVGWDLEKIDNYCKKKKWKFFKL